MPQPSPATSLSSDTLAMHWQDDGELSASDRDSLIRRLLRVETSNRGLELGRLCRRSSGRACPV